MATLDLEIDFDPAEVGGATVAELQSRLLAGFVEAAEAGRLRELLQPAFQQAHASASGAGPAGDVPPIVFVMPTPAEPIDGDAGGVLGDLPGLRPGGDGVSRFERLEMPHGSRPVGGRGGAVGVGLLIDGAAHDDDGNGVLAGHGGGGSSPPSSAMGGRRDGGGDRGRGPSLAPPPASSPRGRGGAEDGSDRGHRASRGSSPDSGGRPLSAERARIRRSIWELNHPTTPVSPSFLMDGSYWHQRAGSRLRELRLQEDLRNRYSDETGEVFRARPPPVATTTPRYHAMQAAEAARRGRAVEFGAARRRARSADAAAPGAAPRPPWDVGPAVRRAATPPPAWGGRNALEAREDLAPPPFRARPVPWRVVAPLYEQMVIEEHTSREERRRERSRSILRDASLPPRVKALQAAARLLPEQGLPDADGPYMVGAATAAADAAAAREAIAPTAIPEGLRILAGLGELARSASAPHELPHSARSAASGPRSGRRDIFGVLDPAAGISVLGDTSGIVASASHISAASGRRAGPAGGAPAGGDGDTGVGHQLRTKYQTPPKRRREVPEQRPERPPPAVRYSIGEVPDFAARHERERVQLERRMLMNRRSTQPAPFVFHAPERAPCRRPQPPKDPAQDWRFQRAAARAASQPAARSSGRGEGGKPPGKGGGTGGGGATGFRGQAMPAQYRYTVKAAQQQRITAERIEEWRRSEEERKQEELGRAHNAPYELKMRVRQAVGTSEPLDDVIERMVFEKRLSGRRVRKLQEQDLERIKERAARRPLLMELADTMVRARRKALLKVKTALEAAGVRDLDNHFADTELDELELMAAHAAQTAQVAAAAADLMQELAADDL